MASPFQPANAASRGRDPGRLPSQMGAVLLLTAIFFLNFLSRIILAPLMPRMEADLGLAHGEAGSLFLLISVGYFLTLIGSGFFSSHLFHRRTIILSAAAVGTALMGVSFCQSLWAIRLGLLAVGLAAGIYLPSGIATLTALVTSRDWGKTIAIHELAPNLSFVAAPLISEALLLWFSWRGVLTALGAASVLAGLAFARFGRGGMFPGETMGFQSVRDLIGRRAFWVIMMLFTLGISGTLGVYTMLPLFLVTEHGIERHWANTLVALSRISGLGMAFLSGWASDRMGSGLTLHVVFFLTGAATILLGLLSPPWLLGMVFLQPLVASCFFPPGFAALSSLVPAGGRNVAVSLTIPVAFILGGGAVPTWIGYMGDSLSFSVGILSVGAAILAGIGLSFLLPSSGRGAR